MTEPDFTIPVLNRMHQGDETSRDVSHLSLVWHTDPILSQTIPDFDFANPPVDPAELAQDMVQFMLDNNGVGLSANQLGLPYRVFVIRSSPEYFACFNPKITWTSEEDEALMVEGCMSYPGLGVKIKRPTMIRFRFQGPNGETYTKAWTGMSSRVVQHEIDHLNGIDFLYRADRFHREGAMRKWRKLQKAHPNA